MMSNLLSLIQVYVGTLIGLCWASFLLFITFLGFLRHPIRFTKRTFLKKRPVMPTCLNDPSLGNHEFIQLEDVRLHYVVNGDESKPLMLFLHGFPEFWYSWRYQLREFSRDYSHITANLYHDLHYRVVAVDQRGYGDSDKPSGVDNYTIDKLSRDVKQLIVALGHEKCILVAHDWGGIVAWNFVSTYPEMVDRLIVCNGPHLQTFGKYLRTHLSQFRKSWYILFFQVPFVPEFMFRANDFVFMDLMFGGFPNNKPSSDDIDAYKYTFAKKGALTPPINYYRAAFSRPTPRGSRTKIDVPTLVIWGEPDVALDIEVASLPAEYFPRFQLEIIKNTNHFVTEDKPKEVNTAIREFLAKQQLL